MLFIKDADCVEYKNKVFYVYSVMLIIYDICCIG
jgi:hypothetical protein